MFVARQCGRKEQLPGHYRGEDGWHVMVRGDSSTTRNICVTLSSLWYFWEKKKNTLTYLAWHFFLLWNICPILLKTNSSINFYSTINHLSCFPHFWFCEETLEIIPEPEIGTMENMTSCLCFLLRLFHVNVFIFLFCKSITIQRIEKKRRFNPCKIFFAVLYTIQMCKWNPVFFPFFPLTW